MQSEHGRFKRVPKAGAYGREPYRNAHLKFPIIGSGAKFRSGFGEALCPAGGDHLVSGFFWLIIDHLSWKSWREDAHVTSLFETTDDIR